MGPCGLTNKLWRIKVLVMPPDSSPPLLYHMTNQEIQKLLGQAVVAPPKMSEEMCRKMVEDLKEEVSGANDYYRSRINTFDRQRAEQQAFTDMEGRITIKMQQEVRMVEELVAFQMAILDKKADDLKEKMETLVTALVEQNRELSRRVTDLEWEGINP